MTLIQMANAHRGLLAAVIATALFPASAPAHPGSGIAVDGRGQVFFLDTGSGLWKIDTAGNLSRLSDQKFHWMALDANDGFAGATLPGGSGSGQDWQILSVGSDPAVLIASDFPIAVGPNGNLYYASGPSVGARITRRDPSGAASVFATLPAAASGQPLSHLNGICSGPDGTIYYTENNTIRRISKEGGVSTVAAVRGLAGAPPVPGIEDASMPYLRGLAVDSRGEITVAASGDGRVLRIARDGTVSTLFRTQSPWAPTAVALSGSDVYVLEFLHTSREVRRDWLPRVRKITPDGKSIIIATVDRMPGAR